MAVRISLAFLLLGIYIALAAGDKTLTRRKLLTPGSDISRSELEEFDQLYHDEIHPEAARIVKRQQKGKFWCCMNTRPINIVTRSRRITQQQNVAEKVKDVAKCGQFGWKRCSVYTYKYSIRTVYATHYWQEAVNGSCVTSQVTCCNLYIKVKYPDGERCVELDRLGEVVKQLGLGK
ncbi:unnamed protein product [Owenia fusiformis]|uniref:Uncharacterized protein n=1 Tax=Owenia fusiformis TaxID=6347 RepID=A0A8J1TZG3_OWEFU|nr:unnamed protein product [Owenia fusiformis]